MAEVLGIPYSADSSDGLEKLLIEPDEFSEFTGRVNKSILMDFLNYLINPDENEPVNVIDCGTDGDGNMLTAVHVYPFDPLLVYTAYLSWGEYTGMIINEKEMVEYINFSGTTKEKLKYPVKKIIEMKWIGKSYDTKNAEIAPPDVSVSDLTLTIQIPLKGNLRVKYRTERHTYSVSIPSRELTPSLNSEQNRFSSIAYAVYEGGVRWCELNLPYDGSYSVKKGCGSRTTISPTPNGPTSVEEVSREDTLDYCSGVVTTRYR